MSEKGRAGIYLIAGLYLLYLAYKMFGFRNDNGGENFTLMVVFGIFFVVAGLGFMIVAWYMTKKMKETQTKIQVQGQEENTDESDVQ